MNRCEGCEWNEAWVRLEMDGKSMHLCNGCYNELMSGEFDLDLERLPNTFTLKDHEGVSRTFYVEIWIVPMAIYMEAKENVDFGYKFAIDGDVGCDQLELFNRLIEKARKGLRERQVETKSFPDGQKYHSIIHDEFKGLIEYDETSEGTPLVVIDGKPFTWEEVGRMLMGYEGFQLKVKLYDFTEDVE